MIASKAQQSGSGHRDLVFLNLLNCLGKRNVWSKMLTLKQTKKIINNLSQIKTWEGRLDILF